MTITIDPSGNWTIYTSRLPRGASALGTVTRTSDGSTGALARLASTGEYVQVNAGAVRTLTRRDVEAALGLPARGRGRPPKSPEERADASLVLRLPAELRAAAEARAEAAGELLSEWVRGAVEARVQREALVGPASRATQEPVSAYEAIVRGWVDLDGYSAPAALPSGIVRKAGQALSVALTAKEIPHRYEVRGPAARRYLVLDEVDVAAALAVARLLDERRPAGV